MTRERYIAHVTLQTGDLRASPRSEVAEDAIWACAELLAQPYDAPAKIPGFDPPCFLRVTREGKATLATVYTAEDAPLATIGIALDSKRGAQLWRMLHRERDDLVTDPARPPGEPWCAVRIEAGVATITPAKLRGLMLALGDFGRVLAWAAVDLQ